MINMTPQAKRAKDQVPIIRSTTIEQIMKSREKESRKNLNRQGNQKANDDVRHNEKEIINTERRRLSVRSKFDQSEYGQDFTELQDDQPLHASTLQQNISSVPPKQD